MDQRLLLIILFQREPLMGNMLIWVSIKKNLLQHRKSLTWSVIIEIGQIRPIMRNQKYSKTLSNNLQDQPQLQQLNPNNWTSLPKHQPQREDSSTHLLHFSWQRVRWREEKLKLLKIKVKDRRIQPKMSQSMSIMMKKMRMRMKVSCRKVWSDRFLYYILYYLYYILIIKFII